MNYFKTYENKLVEISYNYSSDILDVGYIVSEDDKDVLVQVFDIFGFKNGYKLILKENISKISTKTEYLEKIEKLIIINSKENIQNSYIFQEKKIESLDEKNIFYSLLNKSLKEKMICTLLTATGEIFGFVDKIIEDEYVKIKYIEEEHIVKIKDIERIYVENLEDREKVVLN